MSDCGSVTNLVLGEQARSDHAGVGTALGERYLYPAIQGRQRTRARLLHCPVEKEMRCARKAAADHDALGLEHVHVAGDRHTEHAREAAEHQHGVGVPLLRGRDELATGHAPVRVERGGEAGARLVPGHLGRVALERLARAVGLEAAAVRAVARARRAVRHQGEVAELRAEAVRAAEDAPTGHDPAPDAGAERQHEQLVAVEQARLGKRRHVRIVVDEDGDVEAAAELLTQRHARERDVDARLDGARGVVDLRRHPNADRRRRCALGDHLAGGRLQTVEQRRARR